MTTFETSTDSELELLLALARAMPTFIAIYLGLFVRVVLCLFCAAIVVPVLVVFAFVPDLTFPERS